MPIAFTLMLYDDSYNQLPALVKLKNYYLNKTLGIRRRLLYFTWEWEWKLGIHSAQRNKEKE